MKKYVAYATLEVKSETTFYAKDDDEAQEIASEKSPGAWLSWKVGTPRVIDMDVIEEKELGRIGK